MFKMKNYPKKMVIGNTFENDIKELEPRKAYKHFCIEDSFERRMRKKS